MAEDGFNKITINTANGSTELISEPYKNKGSGFILSPEALKLYSALGGGKLLDLVGSGPEARGFASVGQGGRIEGGLPLPAPQPVFPRYVEAEEGGGTPAKPEKKPKA